MATEIKVPAVGESITEGTVSRWLKKEGEAVRAEEPLFELETEKATTEIPAPANGTLHILVPEGKTVGIGAVVARLEDGAETSPGRPKPARQQSPEKKDGAAKAAQAAPKAKKATGAVAETPPPAPERPAVETETLWSPAARRLAQEQGLDASRVKGTGPGGRVTKEDVLIHLERQGQAKGAPGAAAPPSAEPGGPPPPPVQRPEEKPHTEPAPARESRQRLTSIRQRIAERLVAAQKTAAILTTFNEADLTAVIKLRDQYKEAFKKKHGVGLGFMSFFVKAAVEALQSFPIVNAWIDQNDIVYHNYYNIGVAVSTERGLVVPVLRDTERLRFAEIERKIEELAQRARDGKITLDDLQGGTFTITNGGVFGSLLSTPILNPPQSAILGMHAIQKRPVAVDDQVVIRPMMYLALSYDHRLVDGRDAVLFLVRIKECIEKPERMLLDI
jgi:2-oxoglutarate dehydrogenase E2 component (dihydrolipoamide succinyltransferase)